MDRAELFALMNRPESELLDWKENFPAGLTAGQTERERDRGNLLKDLVAIANTVTDAPGHLVFGVRDRENIRTPVGITRSWDDATFQSWGNDVFDPPLAFGYEEVATADDCRIGVFTIRLSPAGPHVVRIGVGGGLHPGQVWIRRGSSNRPALRSDLEHLLRPTEPMCADRSDSRLVQETSAHYAASGLEACLPRLSDKGNKLVEGYRIAFYPGSRREVWVGNSHVLMLRPSGPR